MKYRILQISLLIFLVACQPELINLDKAKKAVAEYYDSGKYEKDCRKLIDRAIEFIESVEPFDSNAVVFDIDETAFDNYQYIKSIGFGYILEEWNKWVNSAEAPPNKEVKRFYNYLRSKNIRIIFLSGRYEETYKATVDNLHSAGYTEYDTLIIRKNHQINELASKFKSRVRKELSEKGYRIIANVGDQQSDFEGGYTGYVVRLPNYLYEVD
ncbi:HAD family acid phosphatase [Melioribacter sp. OK-6-Me]|uniref:HAD family acid phosphatase n=1 Tax=unclassified Melioribacter TaxID=2627329 RepID=UPI003ED91B2D